MYMLLQVKKQGESKFVLEYIDGLTCSDAPQAIHLYKAALKIGDLYITLVVLTRQYSKSIIYQKKKHLIIFMKFQKRLI